VEQSIFTTQRVLKCYVLLATLSASSQRQSLGSFDTILSCHFLQSPSCNEQHNTPYQYVVNAPVLAMSKYPNPQVVSADSEEGRCEARSRAGAGALSEGSTSLLTGSSLWSCKIKDDDIHNKKISCRGMEGRYVGSVDRRSTLALSGAGMSPVIEDDGDDEPLFDEDDLSAWLDWLSKYDLV
jgi:hypothetical protein